MLLRMVLLIIIKWVLIARGTLRLVHQLMIMLSAILGRLNHFCFSVGHDCLPLGRLELLQVVLLVARRF